MIIINIMVICGSDNDIFQHSEQQITMIDLIIMIPNPLILILKFTLTQPVLKKSGTVTASVNAGAAKDEAGNENKASSSTDNEVTFGDTSLVINETDYDQGETDSREFIEIKNKTNAPVNLAGYTIELVRDNSGTPEVYETINLESVLLAANDFYLICDTLTSLTECDQDLSKPMFNLM
ncbi:lamin tail domain-containing protein [Desulfobacterales bacterium HSG17]|nr:lamin tail domain-containing protein [Desulfobacterales bacterium HSG17]